MSKKSNNDTIRHDFSKISYKIMNRFVNIRVVISCSPFWHSKNALSMADLAFLLNTRTMEFMYRTDLNTL